MARGRKRGQGGSANVVFDLEKGTVTVTLEGGTYTPLERAKIEAELLSKVMALVAAEAEAVEKEQAQDLREESRSKR